MEGIEAWHFLQEDKRLRYSPHTLVKPGQTLTALERPIVMCYYGLHASLRAIDALFYAPGPIVCRVTLWGVVVDESDDKLCASHRTCLWMANASPVLERFVLWCAKRTLDRFDDVEPAQELLEAKTLFLDGKLPGHELRTKERQAENHFYGDTFDVDPRGKWINLRATVIALATRSPDPVSIVNGVAREEASSNRSGYENAKNEQNTYLEQELMKLRDV